MAALPPPPPGGDVSRASVVIVPTVVTVIIATVLTLARLYVRISILNRLEWDDFFNVLATLGVIVVMGLTLGATSGGLGRHIYYLDKARAAHGIMLLRICEFILILSTVWLKISISLFLKRLFLTSKPWKIFLWTFIAFNTTTSLLDAAIIFPQCTPVELNWDHSVQGHCWSNEAINATGIIQGGIAAATDFILSTLPIIFLWNIRIKNQVKFGICGVMMLGFSSGAFAVVRSALVPNLTVSQDPTWDLVDLFLWANLEATFGVIAAAAPSVRPLFVRNVHSSESKSRSMLPIPLQSSRKSFTPGRAWYRGMDPEQGDFQNLKEYPGPATDGLADTPSDGGSSQVKMWPITDGRIIKTTDVRVSRDPDAGDVAGNPVPEPGRIYDGLELSPPKALHV